MSKTKSVTRKKKGPISTVVNGAGTLLTTTLGIAGGWIIYSNVIIDHNLLLPDAIPADRVVFNSKTAGRLNYYVSREANGCPLVLIHSVNAAASAYEMGPLFAHYRGQRPVFALDLPGYGFSERARRAYRPQIFADAILDLLETQVGEPADVVALSLGCEFAARAALVQPDHFNSLVLISPSGFTPKYTGRASQRAGRTETSQRIYPILSFPLWGRPLFDLIATRRSIEYFLSQSFTGPITPGFVDYAYATSHQPGAEHVPLHFLSGKLFTPEVLTLIYEKVETPTLVIYDRDAFVRFDRIPELLAKNPQWQAQRVSPTLGLPHFEKLPDTAQIMEIFWSGIQEEE